MSWISRLLRPTGPIIPVCNLMSSCVSRIRTFPSTAVSWRNSVLFCPKIGSRTDSLSLHACTQPQQLVAMVRSMCTQKEELPVMKRPATKENKWINHLKSHREELLNLLLASILLIVTLRMLREKGEKLDEKKSLEKSVENLNEELCTIKQDMLKFVESDLPKIISQSGLKSAKVDILSGQIKERINLILFRELHPSGIVSNTEEAPSDQKPGMQKSIGKGLM
jgi:hypothetical protein